MKKLALFLLVIANSLFAQIEVETHKNNETEQEVKPILDSITRIKDYKTASQYLGLVGVEIFTLPKNPNYEFKKNSKNINIPDNSYFIVDSLNFLALKGYFKEESVIISGHEYDKLVSNKYIRKETPIVNLYIHKKDSNEKYVLMQSVSSYWEKNNDFNQIISIPYFNYLKTKYVDKEILYTPYDYYKYRLEPYKEFSKIDSSDIYRVSKISVKETIKTFEEYYNIKASLINYKNEISEEYLSAIIKRSLLLSEYKSAIESYKQSKIQDSLLIEKRKSEKISQMIKKYGKYYGKIIGKNKVIIGMTKQMCEDAWGKPDTVNQTTTTYGTNEQWVYDYSYLYFENGKLTTIQN